MKGLQAPRRALRVQRLQPLSLFRLASHLCSLVCSCRMLSLARLSRRHCFLQLVHGPLSSGRFIKKSRTRMGWESGDDGGGEGKEHSRGRCEGGNNHLDWTVRLLNTSRLHSLHWKNPRCGSLHSSQSHGVGPAVGCKGLAVKGTGACSCCTGGGVAEQGAHAEH